MRKLLIISLLSTLAACSSMAPEYQRPESPVPENYPLAEQQSGFTAAELNWQEFFVDPVLVDLIDTALTNNRDLRSAILKVEEARFTYRIQSSDSFPHINAGSQAARSLVPGDLNPTGQAITGGEYRAELGLTNWEIDLWGRVRSLNQAALENWLATDAAKQAVQISLIAQLSTAYLNLRELDERIQIARQTVATREQSYRIFQRRYALGSTSKLDLTQVHTLLTQAQSLLVQLEQARAEQLNGLRVLVGSEPNIQTTDKAFDQNLVLVDLSPGLSSELLNNRPDIIAAEHQLRAANANIGAARAAFFPRISLTGSFGSASAQLDDLFSAGSKSWLFLPTISLPIFDAGQRSANLKVTEIQRDLAVTNYEKTIQNAFREVADALAAHSWLQQQLDIQLVGLAAQTERARLATLRYDQGSVAYLDVLDAQRDLLDIQQQIVNTRKSLLASQIDLYRALGGGANASSTALNDKNLTSIDK